MTDLAATILIPTHDHGPLLLRAARSALRQTVAAVELFIVGDGVPDATRDVVRVLEREDDRVRFFDHPKGPRHGEILRHRALSEARGEIVCYLADDDLMLAHHVETLHETLRGADFANALSLAVDGEGELRPRTTLDLSNHAARAAFARGDDFVPSIPLSTVSHSLAMYRRLPYGWRTTPPDVATDRYMVRQFLAQDVCRSVTSTRPTCIRFPSPLRAGWSLERRTREIDEWFARTNDREWRDGLDRMVLDLYVRDHFAKHEKLQTKRAERRRSPRR